MCKVQIPAHVTLLLRQHNWDEVAVYSCTETSIHFGVLTAWSQFSPLNLHLGLSPGRSPCTRAQTYSPSLTATAPLSPP